MKPETLTCLLIDRGAGELPEPVVELLDAYLAANVEASALARESGEALQLSRDILKPRISPALPPLGRERLRKALRQKERSWFRWSPVLAAAACLAVGVLVGRQSLLPRVEMPPVYRAAPNVTVYPEPADTPASAPAVTSFWSQSRFIASASARARKSVDRLDGRPLRAWRDAPRAQTNDQP